jgi:hypothetical protein
MQKKQAQPFFHPSIVDPIHFFRQVLKTCVRLFVDDKYENRFELILEIN